MRVLVFYATIEGQTRKIAEFIAGLSEKDGHEVIITDANQMGFVGAGTYDATIMCAPVHIGRYPTPFVHFAQEWKDALNSRASAFVSVSLAIASEDADERQEAEEVASELLQTTGWTPRSVHHCAGALKYTEYDFFKRWMMKRIAGKEGDRTDTSQDYELTDWDGLEGFVTQFLTDVKSDMKAA